MANLRVLVIAENILARAGLAALLSEEADLTVVGQVAGGDLLADDIDIYRPSMLVWDFGWQTEDSRTAFLNLVEVVSAENMLPVLILLPDDSQAAEAATLLSSTPAGGLLLRDAEPAQLISTLNALALDLFVFDPSLVHLPTADSLPPALTEQLTPRELEVLQLMAEGLANKMIARQLEISDHTVKFHVNAILTKLNAQSRTEAVVRATRLGLIIL